MTQPHIFLKQKIDIAIYHEAKIVQNLMANQANKVQPPKRDPILQNNGEAPEVSLQISSNINFLISLKDL